MKNLFSYSLVLILVFSGPSGLHAQNRPLETRISLHCDSTALREVLGLITEQTSLSFSYSNRQLDDEILVSVHVDEEMLSAVLDRILAGQKVVYRLVEKQIVIRKGRKESAALPPATLEEPERSRITYSGYVRDEESREILIGAAVYIPGSSVGTITNDYGFFSLTLDSLPQKLLCSFVGYLKAEIDSRQPGRDRIDILLKREPRELSEVRIETPDAKYALETTRSSGAKVRETVVRKMPALLGEKDVIKSLAMIPGIKFFGDGSTIFYVRGGARDQNLVTIDEAPIYNPTHMLGFFSTVVPDAIKDVRIFKGDFPANYGGRISSLIDIRTKDGNMNRFGMDASLGLLSSRLSVEGPVWKEHISYFISGRRSYILKPIQRVNEQIRDLHFSDLHVKFNYIANPKNRFFFSAYSGTDNFVQQNTQLHASGINWINAATTIRWNHLYSDRLFSNITLYASRYDYYLNTWVEERNYWNSHIDNVSLKADFTWYQRPGNTLTYGIKIAEHFFNPGNYYEGGQLYDLPFEISTKQTHETAVYFSDRMIIGDRLSLTAGLRITSWQNIGEAVEYVFNEQYQPVDSLHYSPGRIYHSYVTADPRLSLAWNLSHSSMLKFSYSKTSQFEHLLTNSVSPFTSLEVWLPSGPNVKPQRADQITAGYTIQGKEGNWSLETEVYYKKMHRLIDYQDHAEMLLNPVVESELRTGEGEAWGWELLISKKSGSLTGWLSYTLSRAWYLIPEISSQPYPAYSDRPHDLALFLSWELSPRLTLTGNFIYMTGAPFTSPSGFYLYQNHQVPVYLERNNDRLPDYHRLDMALNWKLNRTERKFMHELIFSVYNLYGRKNPVLIHFNKTETESGSLLTPYNYYESPELVATQFYLFGMIPSVSYHFSF